MHGGESRPDSAAIRTTGPHASLADPQTGSAIGREVGSRQWAEGSGVEENPTPHSPLPTPSSAEQAILSLKICDPACGSGHFLIAAAHRMARRLAAVRTGDGEPAPEAVRKALRDVIGHSIYGVDMNPMAVELCKVSLWMEALEPGKPLSFLDHRIQCGNSLIGATPALMKKGIPDEAFKPIEGDDKTTCTEYKRYNKRYRESGQRNLFESEIKLGNLAASLLELEEIDDSTIQGVREKQRRWEQLVRSNDYIYGGLLADAWCAAFVWKKVEDRNHPYPITEELFRKIEQSPWHVARSHHETEIRRLAAQYQFFHWHLAFPDVFCLPSNAEQPENKLAGWNGGFDVVLGNPPWERIKLQEKEWFAQRRPEIANAPNAAARKRMIDDLAVSDEALYAAFKDDIRKAEGESHFVRNSGRYPLCGRGDINTYAIFAETNRMLMSERGRVGCIVPSGIATDDTTKFFFQELMESHTLASLYDFENRAGLFPAVDSRMKFCLLTMTGTQSPARQGAEFVFFAHKIEDLRDDDRCFTLSAEEIALLNPNTRTCPVFRIKRDAELTKAIYRRVPVLIREGAPDGNAWGIEFKRMIDMANDSGLFRTREDLLKAGWRLAGNVFVEKGSGELGVGSREEENAVPTPHSPLPTPSFLPLYEAKMLHHYDHRFGDYDDKPEDSQNTSLPDVPVERLQNPDYVVQPRYWVPRDEVIYKITRVPPDLLKAYRDGDEEKLRLAALQWLAAWDTARESEADWDGLNSKERQARRERRTRAREFLAAHPLTAAECHELRHGREELETTIARLIEAKAPRWLLGWRDITNSTNERTVIASALPRAGVGHTSPLMFTHQGATQVACLQANLTALVFDFVARQKIGGTHLTYGYLNQLPVLPPSTYSQPCSWFPSQTLREWIAPRVLELSYTAHDLRGFAEDCGYTGSGEWGVGNRAEEQIPTPHSPLPTPFKWDEARRFLLRCELDAAYFHLYGIAREDAAYILDTFPIVRRKDEAQHGEYRTKRVILEIYDEMRRAMETGAAYQTRLDPPPANGWTPPALQQEETSTTLEASSKKSVIEGQEDLFTWQSENPQQQLKFGDSD
ncbi:MAG TPA: DNA methyltransferase [Blastocatellia bacterium]|nr:DNA methyltransferase [Blastocatellia bacterium]